jgi:predicted MFS family arabinose efflux permease
VITSAITWRAAFVFQAAIIGVIVVTGRRIIDPVEPDPDRSFDVLGAILSGVGLTLLIAGILAADNNAIAMALLLIGGALVLAWFFLYVRNRERSGNEPLLSVKLFHNRISNLGLVTQNVQWLLLMGTSFVVSVFLQIERGYDAVETGVIFTAATLGILVSSLVQARLAKRFHQRSLIQAGFLCTIAGVIVLLAMVDRTGSAWLFAPGLLLIGLGLGTMLTPSVNIVQSSFPDQHQGEISGLSRSVSNLGSCLGTAIAGTILVANISDHSYAVSMLVLASIGLIGLATSLFLPVDAAEHQGTSN